MSSNSVRTAGVQHPYFQTAVSTALEASHVAKTKGGTVLMIKGYNSGGDQFIQLHDAAELPDDGVVPIACQKAFGEDNFSFLIPVCGLPVTLNGIVVCNSSTVATKTIGAADCWFEVYFI